MDDPCDERMRAGVLFAVIIGRTGLACFLVGVDEFCEVVIEMYGEIVPSNAGLALPHHVLATLAFKE